MSRCPGCPIAGEGDSPCEPARDWPGWCGRIAGEAHQPDGARYWSRKIFDEANKLNKSGRSGRPIAPAEFPARTRPGRRVRVGLVCPVLHQAGAESWMLSLARAVDRSRVAWAGCAVTAGDPAAIDPAMVARLSETMPMGYGADAARALAAACDVLVTWGVRTIAGIVAGLDGPPRILGVAHSPSQWAGAGALYADSVGVDVWVAVSESARDALPGAWRRSARIVGNCVDGARLKATRSVEETRRAWGVPPGSLVAGYYGRLSPEKRPEVMVDVARALPPPWKAVVAGGDYYSGHVHELAEGLPNIVLVGADHRAGDVLRAFDVLASPSDFESWGLSMAEAIEVGTPVVSTPTGLAATHPGLTRLVGHGASGGDWAAEIEAAVFDGRPVGQMKIIEDVRRGWSSGRFGAAWTDAIVGAAGETIEATGTTNASL